MPTTPTIDYPPVPPSKEARYPGTGNNYFDSNAPNNNREENLKIHFHEQTLSDMLQEAALTLRQTFYHWDKKDKQKALDFAHFLLSDKKYAPLMAYRFKHLHAHYYETNRDNALLVICMLTIKDITESETTLLKDIANTLIREGIHPLEKCGRFGKTIFAHILNNGGVTIDLLDFFATLHPKSLIELSEAGDTAMDIVLSNNRSVKLVEWVAQNLPDSVLEKNIKAITPRIKKSKKAQYAQSLLTIRLEKIMLESSVGVNSPNNIETGNNVNQAHNDFEVLPIDKNKKPDSSLKKAKSKI